MVLRLAETIFNRIDKNRTGQISGEQLKEVGEKVQQIGNMTEEQRTKIREGVLEYLNTHDGKIGKDGKLNHISFSSTIDIMFCELFKAFVKGATEKHGVPHDIAEMMFDHIDQGNKGHLDIEDLKAVAARAQARH